MKVLNLLNGPEGCQMGTEVGFKNLLSMGLVSYVKNLYLSQSIEKYGLERTTENICEIIEKNNISLVIIYHLSGVNIDKFFFKKIRGNNKKIIIAYDEHDGYEKFRKPFSSLVKIAMKEADIISLGGLGSIVKMVRKRDRAKIIFTPDQISTQRYDSDWDPRSKRKYDVVMIGNRLTSRMPFKRLSGASEREVVAKYLGDAFGERFALYGYGWVGFVGNKGPLPFVKQVDALREGLVSVGVDHCKGMSHYFSDRLPISMFSGVAHVCHYRQGYEELFVEGDDLLWFHSPKDIVLVVKKALSMGEDYLINLGLSGRQKAINDFSPEVVWGKFIDTVRGRFPYLKNN